MQTVNFQCGNCNNLMGVGAEHLGQQVRCPHCQAVVVAPAAAPAPAASPPPNRTEAAGAFPSFRSNEQDDIFAPPEPTDDLFGQPAAPRVELPPPAPAPQAPTLSLDGPPAPPTAPEPLGSTAAYVDPQAAGGAAPSWMDGHGAAASEAAPADETHGEHAPVLIRKPRDGGGLFIGLVFIPLVSYAVLTTIAIGVLLYRLNQQPPPAPSPLEIMPAFDPNDADHATHIKLDAKGNQTLNVPADMDLKKATSPLPASQIIPLGKKLPLGDLEVEPLDVTRKTMSVIVQGTNPEPMERPSLVLRLKLRNVSQNVVFQPMDRYFNRKWTGRKGPPPLTILEFSGEDSKKWLYGGPAEYRFPLAGARPGGDPPEWVQGDKYSTMLEPGQEMETFVCTDGTPSAEAAVDNYHGKLLWRIHVRRGILPYNGRLVPVSTVVGVEFTDDDYRKSS